ncbi:hypothetical protein DV702_16545 [Sporosarcina sp. PTS2304]|uniref:beta strand repeat-containing protein n=1 Tax=Sporosarcina sp. PTS2304 TaxID=2283194 RepID=UPI000E0D858F|nr:hypothetical protein [Sporosarcina sp. PTS2304]AXI01187.1 hypothetical protein DV702_16545 [Sporosarcina sp. PTS2304]
MKNLKPINIWSKTAMATALIATTIVPVATMPAQAAAISIDEIVVTIDGILYSFTPSEYSDYLLEDMISTNTVSHIKASNGKYYKISDYSDYLIETTTIEETLLELDASNLEVIITPTAGEFDSNGNIIPPTNSNFQVSAIGTTTKTSVIITLDAVPPEAPTVEDFNVTVGMDNIPVTNIVPVVSDVTGKTFTLSVNLNGKEGKVKVNGFESTASFDYKLPTIANVVATDSKHIEVTFSEKVASVSAENISNYGLYGYDASFMGVVNLSSLAPGSATPKLQADEKTVIITLSGNLTNPIFVANGLSNGKYLLYVNNLQDTATPPNTIINNSNFEFYGTTTPASVSIKAQTANYSKAEKTLTVTFTEPTDGNPANIDPTKFALSNGTTSVALIGATPTFPTNSTQVSFDLSTMSPVDYANIEALTGNLSVVIANGAYNDANMAAANGNTVAVVEKVLPVITAATYNTEMNVLKLSFDQTIDVTKIVDFTGITVNGQLITPSATLKTTTNSNVIEIQLDEAQAKIVEQTGTDIRVKTVEDTIVSIPANLFTKVGATPADPGQNVSTTIADATVIHDATPPVVEMNLKDLGVGTGTLTFTSSEELENAAGQFDGTKIQFYASDDMNNQLGSLAVADTLTQVGTSTVYTIDLAINSPGLATALANAVTLGKGIVATVEADAIKDINLTNITPAETSAPLPVSVSESTFGNAVTTKTVVTQNTSLITATFKDTLNNDVRLDGNIAKNVATYEFVSTVNPSIKVQATAEYVWNGTTGELRIFPNTVLTPGSYNLVITGLKTSAGLAVEDAVATDKITLSVNAIADNTKPQLSAATKAGVNIVDKDNSGTISAGDQIILTFDEPMKLTGATAADFVVNNGHTLGSALVGMGADSTQVVITLASNSTIVLGDRITVAETAKITDLAGNQIDSALANKQTGALAKPAGVVAPKIKEAVYEDTNADGTVSTGDIFTVIFDQSVLLANGKTINDTLNDIVVTGASFTSASLNDDTLTLVIGTPGNIEVGMNANVNGTASNVDLLNGWGDKIVPGQKAITSVDTTAPKVTSISYNTTTNGLKLTFSEAINLKGTGTTIASLVHGKLQSADPLGTATNSSLSTDKKSLIVQLDGSEVIDQYTTVLIDAGVLGNATNYVRDASDNKATRGQATNYSITITN